MQSQIMYIELVGEGHRTGWARIGRVSFSKTGKTAYYAGRAMIGIGRAWYTDTETGDTYWIQKARSDGRDRHGKHTHGGFRVEIDDDARDEYWNEIRRLPSRSHERVVHS